MINDPIFEYDCRWYFWDETWTGAYGPFDERLEAIMALKEYCKERDGCAWEGIRDESGNA